MIILYILKLLGPSPMRYALKGILKLRGGKNTTVDKESITTDDYGYVTDEAFFDWSKESCIEGPLTKEETLLLNKPKFKFTEDQKLVQSVLKDATPSVEGLKNLKEMCQFRTRHKKYLFFKELIPLGIVASFTKQELTKMAYACALGSKSISFTLSGAIGTSLPAFYFFHMMSYYVPDKVKPICDVCKYVLGSPFLVVNTMTDKVLNPVEHKVFKINIPIDITQTGGTIPKDIMTPENLKVVLKIISDNNPNNLDLPDVIKNMKKEDWCMGI